MNEILFFKISYATNTFAFVLAELLYNVGILPVPYWIIVETNANDADIAVAWVTVADAVAIYCTLFVTLTLLYPLRVTIPNEPVPFSTILIILSKLPVTAFANDDEIATDEEYWFVFVNLTKPFTFLTNGVKLPVPFSTISNTISKLLLAFVI